jgi:uncharacterized repeat protein (TIGR02543 family)
VQLAQKRNFSLYKFVEVRVMKRLLTTGKVRTTVHLLALCALAVLSLAAGAYAFPAKSVPIVMYHKVDDVTPTIYWVSTDNFRDQMFLLHDLGYETVDFEDLYAHIMNVAELPAKPIIITFDDSYQNTYTHAFPVMQDFNAPNFFGVTHVITDYIGDDETTRQNNAWDQPVEPNTMNLIWPEIAELYNAGWAVEAHSRTHKHNSDPNYDPVYEAGAAAVIAAKLSIPEPNFYPYPFGEYSTALITALQNAGYVGGVNASGGIENTSTTNIWHIKRIELYRDDTLADFASKIGESVPALPTLTINVVGNGSVEINPDQPYYDYDTVVTLTAVSNPSWTFASWSGDLVSSNNPDTITMDSDKTVTANFVFNGLTSVYDFTGVTSPSSTHTAEDGEIDVGDFMIESGTFPARRGTGINGWANWGEATTAEYSKLVGSDDNRYQGANPWFGDNAAMIFEFVIAENPEDIEQIDVSVELGRASPTDLGWVYIWNYNTSSYLVLGSQSGTSDSVVSASITTNPGDYVDPGTGQLTIFVVNEDTSDWIRIDDISVTVYSQAALPEYTLTVNIDGSGSVTKSPDQATYTSGTVVDVNAIADAGWTFDSWSGDLTGSDNPDSITMDANKTVTATFAINQMNIFGYITEPDANVPVEGVFIGANNGGGSDTTDSNGYYELTVDYGWSGTVEPNKTGYTFEPNDIDYSNVTADHNDSYIAILDTFAISGYAVDSEMLAPLEDVLVSPDNDGGPYTSKYYGGGYDTTDANGYYEVVVDYNWSDNIVPSKYAFAFEPNSIAYTNVTEDKVEEQNYVGTLLTYTITGYIKNSCEVSIEGVLVDANNGGGQDTTDVNGFYEVWVDYNWSGMVTPSKQYYTFDPNGMSYIDVQADIVDQNYIAYNVYDLDCDGSIGFGDLGVMADNWLLTGPDIPGDLYKDEDDIVNFLDFAEFGLVW